jgi:DNA polymerase I-like protein with 3'-5' exonuclease and polymerase domains
LNVHEFLEHPTGAIYNDLPHITLDVETTNLDYGHAGNPDNRLLLSVFKDGDKEEVCWGDVFSLSAERIDKLEGDVILVGHNIKFDLKWLEVAGLDMTKVFVWDTMLAEKVLLGNNPKYLPLDLGSVAERYGFPTKGSVVDLGFKAGICASEMPESIIERRCVYDVRVTDALFHKQRRKLTEQGKLGVVLTRCILTPMLVEMERQGVQLDKDRVLVAYNEAVEALLPVEAELKSFGDINWNSPKQAGALLYTKEGLNFQVLQKNGKPLLTKAGAPQTDIDTVMRLKDKTKKQKRFKDVFIKHCKLTAQLTKALNKFKECVDADDILHFDFHQHTTKTHRLSSTGMKYKAQGQNIARMFKRLFRAKNPDWYICECDGANLEFRGAVDQAQDEQGLEDILNPEFDAHLITASEIFGVPPEEVTKDQRQDAKSRTFKPLYGGSSGTKTEQAYFKKFKERYKGIAKMQERWLSEALLEKSVTLATGFQFFFPYTRVSRSGYQEDTTSICNYPVQSFATADVIPIALVYTWLAMKQAKLQATIVNTIHDSIIIEAPKDEEEKLNEILIDSFTTKVYNYLSSNYGIDMTTPLGVGIKWGKFWSEGEEFTIDIPNENII